MSNMLVLIGTDNHVTTLNIRTHKTRKRKIHRFFQIDCSCGNLNYPETWDHVRALVKAEVHARLWHGAEPERKWRR